MSISLLFEHFILFFLSWFPSYHSSQVFFLPMIVSPWVSSWALIQAHMFIAISYLPSFIHCSSHLTCPFWSNLATSVDAHIYVSFEQTNLFPVLNSKYAKHNLWDAPNIEKSIFPASFPFCIPYLSVWYHHLYGYSGIKFSHLLLHLCKVTHYSFL